MVTYNRLPGLLAAADRVDSSQHIQMFEGYGLGDTVINSIPRAPYLMLEPRPELFDRFNLKMLFKTIHDHCHPNMRWEGPCAVEVDMMVDDILNIPNGHIQYDFRNLSSDDLYALTRGARRICNDTNYVPQLLYVSIGLYMKGHYGPS